MGNIKNLLYSVNKLKNLIVFEVFDYLHRGVLKV